MVIHTVAHARAAQRPLSDPDACWALWRRLRREFPDVLAACLMPDHLHMLLQSLARDEARRRLGRQLGAFSRERSAGPQWQPVPQPTRVLGDDKVERQIRYIHLNPDRAGLVTDPMSWLWSTHRDVIGARVDPWVGADKLAAALGRPDPDFTTWFHRYVSSDPTVAVSGTPLPGLARAGTLDEIEEAACCAAARRADRRPAPRVRARGEAAGVRKRRDRRAPRHLVADRLALGAARGARSASRRLALSRRSTPAHAAALPAPARGVVLLYTRPMADVRHDWTLAQAREIHDLPLFELIDRSRAVHTRYHAPSEVQLCTLLSVKTGGCPEDCAYCPQSSHHETSVKGEAMLKVDDVLAAARRAKDHGASRFCMGAAWREVKDGPAFERVLDMVRGVRELGMEACVTLGMLDAGQAKRLADAGLTAYNHNLDTSRDYYKSIISTRNFDERLATLRNVRDAGITVCSGGIIGMGESVDDRCGMLLELAKLEPHPESVPVNALVRVEGTPLAALPPIDPLELVRMIALARVMMPRSKVRLSAGRTELPREAQLLCMYAGANSIFYGDKLLTTPNPGPDEDESLITAAGLTASPAS